jgi:Nickel/cobalt transporter regulator
MKKFLLAGIATAIAFSPAAHAMQVSQAEVSVEDSSDFRRGEGRRGGWGRGQGQTQQSEDTGQRGRDWRSGGQEQPQRRSDDRRGGWRGQSSPQPSPQSQPQPQDNGDWRRGNEGRRWEGRTDNDNRNGEGRRWEDRRDDRGNWEGRRSEESGRYDNRRGDTRWEGRNDDSRRDEGRRWEGGQDDDRRWDNGRGYSRSDHRGNDRWDRGWRSDRRYDWRGHRNRYHNSYRPGRYYAPGRYHSYRRFNIGIHVGSPLYSSRYWLSDPWQYRLPEAYGPYRWVRYYDDVLLIDIRNGYVVDVIHDFFW